MKPQKQRRLEAAKKRALTAAAVKEREQLEREAITTNFSAASRTSRKAQAHVYAGPSIVRSSVTHRDLPSLITYDSQTGPSIQVAAYEGALAAREELAQEEVKAKRTQVAVLYNKGPYQFVSPGMDPKTFGRK